MPLTVYGTKGQKIIWDSFFQIYGRQGVIAVVRDVSPDNRRPDRQADLMSAYWQGREVGSARPGHIYFPEMLYRLVYKPTQTNPFGDYSRAEREIFVMGFDTVRLILRKQPRFQAVIPTGQDVDPGDIFDGFQYMNDVPSNISRFLAFNGEVWSPYFGATDTEFPDDIPTLVEIPE